MGERKSSGNNGKYKKQTFRGLGDSHGVSVLKM